MLSGLQIRARCGNIFDNGGGNTQLPDVRRGGFVGFAPVRTLRSAARHGGLSVLFRDDVRGREILFPLRREGGSN